MTSPNELPSDHVHPNEPAPSASDLLPPAAAPTPTDSASLKWLRLLILLVSERSGGRRGLLEATLRPGQVRLIFEGLEDKYPPILTYKQAAELVQVALPTLKGWFSQGQYANCVKRNNPGRVLRDAFVQQFLRDRFGINAE